jgi:RND family efflux transporter MFP subunit
LRLLRFSMTVALLIGLAGCSAKPLATKADPPIEVRLGQVQSAESSQSISAAGTLALRLETPLGFTSSGRIANIYVQEGDSVRRGQVLATLDTTAIDANLASAVAEQVRADAELKRSAILLKDGWVTQPRVDSARAAADAASATVRARKFATDTARITAPSNGVVLARSVEPSQIVDAGTPVVVLGEQSGGFVLRVPLNDRDTARVMKGAPATILFEGIGQDVFRGQIIEVGGRAQAGTGAFEIEIAVPRDPRLRSGLIGTASIASAGPAAARQPLVPPTAIFAPRAGSALVYVVGADNRARLRKLSIGEATNNGVVVTGGISPGEWVAVSAIDRLTDGKLIAPTKMAR